MRLGLLLSIILLLLAACGTSDDASIIHLSNLQSVPAAAPSEIIPLRISVAAVISPRGTAESYQPLMDYLSQHLNRPVELVQRRTYAETNQLVQDGEVDIAFVCTSAYVNGHDSFGMEIIAAPQVHDAPVYYSLLIVPSSSAAQSMDDLRGKVFAFTDPISHTGRVYPTYLVRQSGSTPEEFFARTFFTYNHDNAIRAVAEGLADGAAVDSLVYEFALERDPSLADSVRIIHESPPFASPPIVVNPDIRPQLRATLQDILFNMDKDPEGQHVLQTMGIERFVSIDDSAYDGIREIMEAAAPLTP